ncbi:MAG: hypothetical protein HKN08_09810, partial [Gammaproteobacteria bacterium]|nr:hypothetical protein [Gammaproteobacteria bacterium]
MTAIINNRIKKNDALGLVFYAAASLYLELALIRFTAAEVLYLGYFSNFILISAFIGLGLGFLSYKRGIKTDQYVPFVMLFIFSLILVSEFDVTILRDNFGEFFFGNISGRSGLPGSFLLAALLISTVILFTGLGCRIAESFSKFKPLTAYTLDISGSIFGIALFSLHSLVSSSPVTWVITTGLLLITGYLI